MSTDALGNSCVTANGSYPQCCVCGVALTHAVVFMGKQYDLPDDPRKRYCSQRCKQAAYRTRIAYLEQFHGMPDGFTLRERNRKRRSRSERSYFDRAYCATCGKQIPAASRADARYCSQACRQRAYRSKRRSASTAATELLTAAEAA